MLNEELEKTKKEVDLIIDKYLKKGLENFKEETIYQINTGGKRIRPFLAVNFYKGLGGENIESILKFAAAIEIFHNSSLLLDDIIDRGALRRGKETSWKKYGPSLTMCISSFYFSTITDLLGDFDSKLNSFFSLKTKKVMEGELMDILQERGGISKEPFYLNKMYESVRMKDYMEMVEKKTAALFELSCGGGGYLAKDRFEEAKKIGNKIGIAYQIRDDILDIFGDKNKFGKEIGKDIKERKGGNIVLLFAQKENDELTEILSMDKINEKSMNRAMEIINKSNAHSRANILLDEYITEALNLLSKFPKNPKLKIIKKLINYLKIRKK